MRIDLANLRDGERPAGRARSQRFRWRRLLPVGLLILGALLPMLAADSIDEAMMRRGWRPGESRVAALQAWAGALAELEAADLPLLQLDLKFKKYQRLVNKRQAALDAGKLVVGKSDFVPGTIRVGGAAVQVSLRLQGSDLNNLRGKKWSLRVHARRGGHVLGIERFTLRSPEADGYLRKAAVYEHLRMAGVAAPRHHFVRLAINGTPIGVMSLEEYFSNELIAGQRRPEGPILRFGKALLHASEEAAAESDDVEADAVGMGALDNYRLARVRLFRANRTLRDPKQRAMALEAVALLRGFASGRLPAERVFDLSAMARLLAVCELWGAAEMLQWPNMRFFYNPLLERLEPIGYASQTEAPQPGFGLVHRAALTRDLLAFRPMRQAFVDALLSESKAVVEGGRLQSIVQLVARWQERIRAEYPMVRLDPPLLGRAGAVLAGHSKPAVSLLARRSVVARSQPAMDKVRLANPLLVDVRVVAAHWHLPPPEFADRKRRSASPPVAARKLPATQVGGVRLPLELTSTAVDGAPTWTELRWLRPEGLGDLAELEFDVQIADSEEVFTVRTSKEVPLGRRVAALGSAADPSWLKPITGSRGFTIPAGRWKLAQPLVLPSGFTLRLEPGCNLMIGSEGRIVVRGPLEARGTQEHPIVIHVAGSVGIGPPALMVERGGQANLAHVRIVAAEPGGRGRGLVFYETDLNLSDGRMAGLAGPAAIRVARGKLQIIRTHFEQLAGDGVMVEYGSGSIADCTFSAVGGDGIDIADSELKVERCQLEGVVDKAVSVGEGSKAELSNLTVRDVAIGVAAKDSSHTIIRDSRFEGVRRTGLVAFTKKRRFGAAHLEATSVVVTGAQVPFLAQGGSQLVVDGVKIAPSGIALADLVGAATPTGAPP